MKKNKKFIAGVLLFFVGIPAALLFFSNPPTISDSDLQLIRPIVLPKKNAFFVLEKAGNALHYSNDDRRIIADILDLKLRDEKFVAEILRENETSLALFEQGLKLPHLLVPALQKFDDDYPYLDNLKALAALACLRAENQSRAGQEIEAFALALQVIRLGHLLEDSGGAQTHYGAGSSIKSSGLKELRQLTARTSLPCDQLVNYVKQLNSYKANRSGVTNVIKAEYQLATTYFADFAAGNFESNRTDRIAVAVANPVVLNREKTKKILVEKARLCLGCISKTFNELPVKELSPPTTKKSIPKLLFDGNLVGEFASESLFSSWSGLFKRVCSEKVQVSATQIILALRCYQLKHEKLPPSLSTLVPEFFDVVPIDDFDGKPLRYSVEKKIVYSVGQDLLDSGGQETNAAGKSLDMPFKINF